jgi:hypothetical protein
MMQTVKSVTLDRLPLENLVTIADLIYHDGPILSLLHHPKGDHYLYCWSDADEQYNRWLIFRVVDKDLQLFLEDKEITLRQLILNPVDGFLYIVDMDDQLNYRHIKLIYPTDLPSSYLPDVDTYYEFEPIFYEDVSTQTGGLNHQNSLKNTNMVSYAKI